MQTGTLQGGRIEAPGHVWFALVAALLVAAFATVSTEPPRVIPVSLVIDGERDALAVEGRPECFEFDSKQHRFRSAGVRGVRFTNISTERLELRGAFMARSSNAARGDAGQGTLEPGESGFGVWRAYDLPQIQREIQAGHRVTWSPAPIRGIEECTLSISVHTAYGRGRSSR